MIPRRASAGPLAPRERPDWMDDPTRACASEPRAMFFGAGGGAVHAARKVCDRCPVKDDCLAYALKYGVLDGVWGGTSGEEREAILKARAS